MLHHPPQRNPHAEVGVFVMRLCWILAALMLARTPLLPLAKLGDAIGHLIPDLPGSDTYGKVCVCMLLDWGRWL